jgi:hypothetical protein
MVPKVQIIQDYDILVAEEECEYLFFDLKLLIDNYRDCP